MSEIHKIGPGKDEKILSKDHLIVQVDGGHIQSCDHRSRSFEALVSEIYSAEDHISGGLSKNGLKKSGFILNKTYSASALKDRCKTMKTITVSSATRHGMTSKTRITGLSDGASNCWNVIKELGKHCSSIEFILDWHHIKTKFDQLVSRLEDPYADEAESLKWKIWHGKSQEAIAGLNKLYVDLLATDHADKIHSLLKYLSNNIHYLANYRFRKDNKLPYTSSVIESAIETLVNTRHKKKHKAQWSRQGAHNILQIRTSRASNNWGQEWDKVKQKYYVPKIKAA